MTHFANSWVFPDSILCHPKFRYDRSPAVLFVLHNWHPVESFSAVDLFAGPFKVMEVGGPNGACPMKIGAEELGIALILGVQKGHLLGVYLLISMTHLARQRCHSLFCGLTFMAFR